MPTRRNVAAAVVAIGLARAAGADAQPVVPSPALAEVRRELEAFRTELKRAAETRDIAKLRLLLADTFTHTHASGRTEDKAARMIALAAREPAIESGLVLDAVVHTYGPDTAILTARSPLLNRDDNRTYDVRWMQVFTRMSGQWQLAASQVTTIQPEK
jgi:hypothetical protein